MHNIIIIVYYGHYSRLLGQNLMIVQAVVTFFHVQSSIPFTLIVVLISPPLQDWLASSARKVGLAGRPMEWLTPLGLPVVQPYHKPSSKVVSTHKMCEIVC